MCLSDVKEDPRVGQYPLKRSSQYRGVSGHKQTGKWISQVKHNRKQVGSLAVGVMEMYTNYDLASSDQSCAEPGPHHVQVIGDRKSKCKECEYVASWWLIPGGFAEVMVAAALNLLCVPPSRVSARLILILFVHL